ncbi:MAG: hypothetical protein ACLFMW_08065 [Ectothiorhodospira sp.]
MSHANESSGQEHNTIHREAALRRRMVRLERELQQVEAELDRVRQSRSRQGEGKALPPKPRSGHPVPVVNG